MLAPREGALVGGACGGGGGRVTRSPCTKHSRQLHENPPPPPPQVCSTVWERDSLEPPRPATSNGGGGVGMFYLPHECLVVLLSGSLAAYHPSLYLDAHGEEDRHLRRGKPLFLSPSRQAALMRLWLGHRIPVEVSRARAAAPQVIRRNHY